MFDEITIRASTTDTMTASLQHLQRQLMGVEGRDLPAGHGHFHPVLHFWFHVPGEAGWRGALGAAHPFPGVDAEDLPYWFREVGGYAHEFCHDETLRARYGEVQPLGFVFLAEGAADFGGAEPMEGVQIDGQFSFGGTREGADAQVLMAYAARPEQETIGTFETSTHPDSGFVQIQAADGFSIDRAPPLDRLADAYWRGYHEASRQ